MTTNDVVLLLLGVFLGAALGLLVALFVQPLLEDGAQRFLIRLIGKSSGGGKQTISGEWRSIMAEEGTTPDLSLEDNNYRLTVLRQHVTGVFSYRGRTYRILGRRTENWFTGTYQDTVDGNTFRGAFQLKIHVHDSVMEGMWIGYNSNSEILRGYWLWRRSEADKYSFQRTPEKK